VRELKQTNKQKMTNNQRIKIWGEYGCFTRPEMKAERVSYEVITPSAARNLLQSIHWKPQFDWVIDRIEVLKPIQFMAIKRNELADSIATPRRTHVLIDEHQQRSSLVLRNVAYIIEAHVELKRGNSRDEVVKHLEIFNRRLERGQCFQRPYMGCREFEAYFGLPEATDQPIPDTKNLGYMLLDIEYTMKPGTKEVISTESRFFEAKMVNGVIEVPNPKTHRIVK
jgi:CRISPR-associated protein Cas5d